MIQINTIKLVNQVSDHQVHQRREGHLQHGSILGQEGKNLPGLSLRYKTFKNQKYDQHFPGTA